MGVVDATQRGRCRPMLRVKYTLQTAVREENASNEAHVGHRHATNAVLVPRPCPCPATATTGMPVDDVLEGYGAAFFPKNCLSPL
jgi:hypothetical protein